ncbi:hypothetical protein N7493_006593 [Penicillium malachiteum]|uniref:Uncharacterized protein n=1 Tax=Penicillium malachiteum TaxID=1324776 RepID=A0AAD6HLQ2_9EURO|nr:hypothetical protein N7493_006593 [Penicillium malachiteum]
MKEQSKALSTGVGSLPVTEVTKGGEVLVECWDIKQQSISTIPALHIKKIFNGKDPLLPEKHKKEGSFMFPLCPDHLIILLQFNALRAMAINRTLISGILYTPLDCDEERFHIVPCPTNPELLPATLFPTILQQTVPHADWINLFPYAEGRDRLIQASGTFDENELWDDCIGGLYQGLPDDEIERRGIIAWSPCWSITGWEMSEGFLRKWGWLFHGLPEVLEPTNCWRLVRGEEPFIY